MKNIMTKNWFLTSLNGILAILFGIVALTFPSITVLALVIYFAISVLIGGIGLTFVAFRLKNENPNWSFILLEGIIGLLFGLIILLRPEFTAVVLITLIGIWSIILGVIFTIAFFRIKYSNAIRNVYLTIGVISLLFGLLIVVNPFEGPRTVIVLIGLYAITYGVFSIINNLQKNKS
jgi:hypothetical protein